MEGRGSVSPHGSPSMKGKIQVALSLKRLLTQDDDLMQISAATCSKGSNEQEKIFTMLNFNTPQGFDCFERLIALLTRLIVITNFSSASRWCLMPTNKALGCLELRSWSKSYKSIFLGRLQKTLCKKLCL